MIKKLKRKFIIIFMSIAFLTLAGIFIFVSFSTWKQLENECRTALANHSSKIPRARSLRSSTAIVISLQYSRTGKQTERSINYTLSIKDSEVDRLAKYCLNAEEDYGTVPDSPFAYMKRKDHEGTSIAFYDLTESRETMHHLLFSFLFAGVAALLLFYVLSLFLSNWCIHPIEKTWNKQQKFVADASHELKTPLTVILANAAIIKENPQATIQDKEKFINYIEDEAKHMSGLVNDLLFLAKTDAFRETVVMSEVNISDICFTSYLSFESVAFEKGIDFVADIDDDIMIQGMADKLEHLCRILLDNACKYTDENGQIRMSLHRKGDAVLLEINNSGTPIPKEQIPFLFERFYRVDEARTRTQSGYGLGLSIAHSIVELHKGKISIQSTEEEGTTISVELS